MQSVALFVEQACACRREEPETQGEKKMPQFEQEYSKSLPQWLAANISRVLVALFVPVITFFAMWRAFIFMRESDAPQAMIALVAIITGVGGVAILYIMANWFVEQLPAQWTRRLQPFVFVGPAIAIMAWYLFIPALRSFHASFFDANTQHFVGLSNYLYTLTDKTMLEAYRNNLFWLIFGTLLSVGFGLLIAILADRSKFEFVAKTLIFLPMAISMVGASVIWKFVYAFKPASAGQIGLLNAIVVAFGGEPVGWLQLHGWNTFFLIAILVWLQTGYAMVILSAAIKQVPTEIMEAGRIDGANELQIFFRIIIPTIQGTIVMVPTTVLIMTLKVFDIVYSMTNGLYGTEVIASLQVKQMFRFRDYGRGSAIAILLLLAVIPIMWYNLREFFGKREVFK